VDDEVVDNNRILSGMAYAKGLTICPAYPSNLYLTVTEACNLSCRHCITGAPTLTREGRAREIGPWLLEALRDAFAAADYFGFTHGGESLVSPMLPEALKAIRAARGDRPYHVHLLTNGKLLDGETTRQLIGLGVTSLMVSLDGATADANEAFRCGGSFATVLEHIRDAVRVRERLQADLRIGISMVVGRSNVDQLPAMGDLAKALGVDWLKIEEIFPATSFARQEMIAPAHPLVLEGMAALRERLAGSKLVLVDHLNPDPEAPSFRRADNYANRACFHPQMSGWEQACVDPDGSVHLVDYHQPAIGNLCETSFFDIWNGDEAQRTRQRWLP
jgi:MoaA/NifB/PqqE/SkfB family radical SAM enzyme